MDKIISGWCKIINNFFELFKICCFNSKLYFFLQKLEETFAQQLEEQERVYGPITPLTLPSDLPDLSPTHSDNCSRIGLGSTRSSLSSVSES